MALISKNKIPLLLKLLKKHFPNSNVALKHHNSLQLLVATILSAQCTDAQVNKVTKKLFQKYKSAKDFANAKPSELQQLIYSTGYYKNKAKNIIGAGKKLVESFHSNVPQSMAELIQLPGVARKTANIVLSAGFGKVDGIAVDTHVFRVSRRLGLSNGKNPEKAELDLMHLIPKKDWWFISSALIEHGRKTCGAKKPLCSKCFLNKVCSNAFKVKNWK